MEFDFFLIKRVRTEKKLSQSELAFQLDLTPSNISMLEGNKKCRPSFSLVMRICDSLGIKAEQLIVKD